MTNCEAECLFSKLALIKNRLKSTQIGHRQEWLDLLTIMIIEIILVKNCHLITF